MVDHLHDLRQPAPTAGQKEVDARGGHRDSVTRDPQLKRVRVEIQQLRVSVQTGAVIATGSNAGAGLTSLQLRIGDLDVPPAKAVGIPVGYAVMLQYLATSFFATSVTPASPWTLTLYVRRKGESAHAAVATFSVNTEL